MLHFLPTYRFRRHGCITHQLIEQCMVWEFEEWLKRDSPKCLDEVKLSLKASSDNNTYEYAYLFWGRGLNRLTLVRSNTIWQKVLFLLSPNNLRTVSWIIPNK